MTAELMVDIDRFPWIIDLVNKIIGLSVVQTSLHHLERTSSNSMLVMDTGDGHVGSEEDRRCDWCHEVQEPNGLYMLPLEFSYRSPRPNLIITVGVCEACRAKMASVMAS